MIGEEVGILFQEGFEDDKAIIMTIFCPTREIGLVIAGKDMYPAFEQKNIINIDLEWELPEERHASHVEI
ncbi:MAG: hypothetical protein ACE3JQ_12450 [Paenisporosarcina sp.]